jgi:hypothetical protein
MVRKIPKVRRMRTGRKKQSLRSLTVMKMDVSRVSEYTNPSRVHTFAGNIHLNAFTLNQLKLVNLPRDFRYSRQ